MLIFLILNFDELNIDECVLIIEKNDNKLYVDKLIILISKNYEKNNQRFYMKKIMI